MIFRKEPIWEQCTKEEFESAIADFPTPIPYRAVPIYNGTGGILNQIKQKKPDGVRYEKVVGWKDVILLTEKEASDMELIKLIEQWAEKHS